MGTMNQSSLNSWPIDTLLAEAGRIGDRAGRSLLETAYGLLTDDPSALDLKISATALEEMREAFRVFAPYRSAKKVTVFGSARTKPDEALYHQARDVAARFAAEGWMVVTGAGPGLMAAANEGAGREMSFGVNIRLPFEQGANPIISGDVKLATMKYFFTRKLMLMKESQAFVCLPGGFGTLDETFELLTLAQTGKGAPAPIVLLDVPGDPYWEAVDEFVRSHLIPRRLINAVDASLYRITESCEEAIGIVSNFYRNYDSLRFVGDLLFLRVRQAPDPGRLAELNKRFGAICSEGSIGVAKPHREELADNDKLDLVRLRLKFDKHQWGELHQLIEALNDV